VSGEYRSVISREWRKSAREPPLHSGEYRQTISREWGISERDQPCVTGNDDDDHDVILYQTSALGCWLIETASYR